MYQYLLQHHFSMDLAQTFPTGVPTCVPCPFNFSCNYPQQFLRKGIFCDLGELNSHQ